MSTHSKPQVKIITKENEEELEKGINEFLKKNFIGKDEKFTTSNQKKLVDIKFNYDENEISGIIIYEKY